MNRALFIILFAISSSCSFSQTQSSLIEIPGKIISIEIIQDDISFYTWSLYITLKVDSTWMEPVVDVPEINIGDIQKKKHPAYTPCDPALTEVKFSRHGFHIEKDAKEFYKRSKKGKRILIKVEMEDWENYVFGKKCLLHISTTSRP